VKGQWFSPVSSINKTDCHDITEILLNTITLTPVKDKNNLHLTSEVYVCEPWLTVPIFYFILINVFLHESNKYKYYFLATTSMT
jgi:hypothetical protein